MALTKRVQELVTALQVVQDQFFRNELEEELLRVLGLRKK